MATEGYDPDFLDLDHSLRLPQYRPELHGFVLRRPELTELERADYPNFSIITNQEKRSPIYAALNIDLVAVREQRLTGSDPTWKIDSRIGGLYQLRHEHFAGTENHWDKGHIAAKESVGWGVDEAEAQINARQTFVYSNAALQHKALNQHEWRALESWVRDLGEVRQARVSTFTGPIYGAFPRKQNAGPDTFEAEVPAGFFKVICYVDSARELQVRAFMLLQDRDALVRNADRPFKFDLQNYQVTVSEIEELTGLEFPGEIRNKNPLRYGNTEENRILREQLNISALPEQIEVNDPIDIQDEGVRPDLFRDETKDIFIAAAMPNPEGTDRGNEWVSIINLQAAPEDLTGWWLSDNRNDRKVEDLIPEAEKRLLAPGAALSVPLQGGAGGLRLVNTGGAIVLYGPSDDGLRGNRMDRVAYSAEDVVSGVPVIFPHRITTS